MADSAAYRDLLVAAANHPDAEWRIEGSADFDVKPGRLLVWVELDEVEWDAVYDELNAEGSLRVSAD